jgi:ADP-ribose pyrophosphatase YjhB (NUDIX family)
MKVDKFTIRVYGIVLFEQKLLTVHENLNGISFVKFPGGGVEPGEGLLDALKREIREELNTEVLVCEHFYTTDFFQRSAFREDEQVVAVYYRIQLADHPKDGFMVSEPHQTLTFFWKPITGISAEDFTLTIDKHVATMLIS